MFALPFGLLTLFMLQLHEITPRESALFLETFWISDEVVFFRTKEKLLDSEVKLQVLAEKGGVVLEKNVLMQKKVQESLDREHVLCKLSFLQRTHLNLSMHEPKETTRLS